MFSLRGRYDVTASNDLIVGSRCGRYHWPGALLFLGTANAGSCLKTVAVYGTVLPTGTIVIYSVKRAQTSERRKVECLIVAMVISRKRDAL